ncbi:hypothetical protein KUCAC02_010202 [Chaenocephalus aceratus]|uniref:Uncharacterized protein n=1 Tax=Chaenocephalus aceratus TaxID=36190 RepID=A0ACB9VZ55_CHAAC|nr:hypothetical protein KUCAC02_010202 [Chaenocephalus aceratus]
MKHSTSSYTSINNRRVRYLLGSALQECYSWGQLCSGSSQGDVSGSSQEAKGGFIFQGRRSTLDHGGALWPQGPSGVSTLNPPPVIRHPPWPVKISPNKTWRRVADLEKEG